MFGHHPEVNRQASALTAEIMSNELVAGSIFDSHKRRAVQPLMYVRLASLATETGVLGEGLLAALPSQVHQLLPVRGIALSYM